MRDRDRYFYLNDPVLAVIRRQYGIDYCQTLAEVIGNNSEFALKEVPANVFLVQE